MRSGTGGRWTYRVALQFSVRSEIEEAARSIVRSSTNRVSVREELNRVDIRIVGSKGLHAFLLSNVPDLGKSVTGARYKHVVVDRIDAQTHYIAEVVGKVVDLGASIDVPQNTGHVAR